jgi:TonB family protein
LLLGQCFSLMLSLDRQCLGITTRKPVDRAIRCYCSIRLRDFVNMLPLGIYRLWLFVVLLASATHLYAQSSKSTTPPNDDSQKSAQKSSAAEDSVDEEIYDVGGDVKPPRVIHRVVPEFTQKSRDRHVEGSVILAAVVTSKGEPRRIRVQKGVEQDLDEQAVEALKQWQFAPGTKDSKPVATRVSIEIRFNVL